MTLKELTIYNFKNSAPPPPHQYFGRATYMFASLAKF